MRDTRAAKSFRAAAERIVRQESATPSTVGRLLERTPVFTPPRATSEQEAWTVRLSGFAAIGEYDAFAITSEDPSTTSLRWQVREDPFREPAVRAAVEGAKRTRAIAQVHVPLTLADGRIAAFALAVPLALSESETGALLAMRVGRSFAAGDAARAAAIAELVSLEIVRARSARRDAVARRQALGLYELARAGLFAEDLGQSAEAIAGALAGSFEHDLVQIWLARPTGALDLIGTWPTQGHVTTIAHPEEHEPLPAVLLRRDVVRMRHAAHRAWLPDHIADAIVAPLDSGSALGALVVGRTTRPYAAEDEELSGVIGEFVGRVVAMKTLHIGPEAADRDAEETVPATAR